MWKKYIVTFFLWLFLLLVLWLFFCLPFMYCIYNISFIGRDARKSNIYFIEISCPPMKSQTSICISDFWYLNLIMLICCFNKYVQCQHKHEWQINVKKLYIFILSTGFVWLHFCGHVYCIHFCFLFFGSLYIQVMQGCIHHDHEDLINKHVMMIRVTDNI